MNIISYVVLGILVVAVAWWGIKVATGMMMPLDKAAVAYFYKRIRDYKVDQFVTPAFVAESVAACLLEAAKEVKWSGGGMAKVRAATMDRLDNEAHLLFQWVSGAPNFDEKLYQRQRDLYAPHKVPRRQ